MKSISIFFSIPARQAPSVRSRRLPGVHRAERNGGRRPFDTTFSAAGNPAGVARFVASGTESRGGAMLHVTKPTPYLSPGNVFPEQILTSASASAISRAARQQLRRRWHHDHQRYGQQLGQRDDARRAGQPLGWRHLRG